ncbi:LLM class flavin-dependent oxidoreductase [Caldovatus aquaticus]|uniref:LLM class flavin-dependent oxidoreductase n=1 Tax=Caldovatus aquaticus TaxID=2865671 RepID=A0ABS7F4K0_9PROT|nr:LLM class flavin-dependent oxidoreductase [Caldovatus aquaticus]MBW8270545.1 LLM class flavin-dependent oxidoreductase [Caldovatus aquaticus]
MDFGHFNLMSYRVRGTPTRQLVDNEVEQVKLAEQAGFSTAWVAEHHFSNYCVSPSPLLMLARLAGETRTIRLGTAVVVVPLYHPARLLAEIGLVDSMARGRLVLGVGSGYQPYEFDRFGEDLRHSVPKVIEFMRMLELAFGQETFSFEGEHYRMPETHIASRTVGDRLPEIWIAGDNPELHRLAARKGYGVMVTPRHFTAGLLARARERFAAVWTAEGRDPRAMRFAVSRHVCIADSREEVMRFVEHSRSQVRLSQSLRRREELMDGAMLVERPYENEPTLEQMADNLLVGSPEVVAERIAREVRLVRPDHYLMNFSPGGSDQATALRSIERFATEVRPLLEKALGPLDRIGAGGGTAG